MAGPHLLGGTTYPLPSRTPSLDGTDAERVLQAMKPDEYITAQPAPRKKLSVYVV